MNDFELESQLKAVPLPTRSDEYWEQFPSSVHSQLPPHFPARPQKSFLPRLALVGGFALAYLTFALVIGPAFYAFLQNEKTFQHKLAELPNHLRIFMADEHGLHRLIADRQ
ncbi:MAG: hypothetical protein ACLPRE_11555 [Limisphaerales bacterium]